MSTVSEEVRAHASNRVVSDRLLTRLLRYHGNHPPDASAAYAIETIRKGVRRMILDDHLGRLGWGAARRRQVDA